MSNPPCPTPKCETELILSARLNPLWPKWYCPDCDTAFSKNLKYRTKSNLTGSLYVRRTNVKRKGMR